MPKLHPCRFKIAERLREENLSMLAYVIETGKHITGYYCTQSYYDDCIKDCLDELEIK